MELFFRLSKEIHWGGGLPVASVNSPGVGAAPLFGTVEGVVKVRMMDGGSPAVGVPVSLDGQRSVATSADGHYLFRDVAEGLHEVSLSATELPAEYDPAAPGATRLSVQPRRSARADFEVLPLAFIEGKVTAPAGVALEGILVRLLPGERYTTTAADGHFAFYNVREGDYTAALDIATLPENTELASGAAAPAVVRAAAQSAPVEFRLSVVIRQKPIRKVLDLDLNAANQ